MSAVRTAIDAANQDFMTKFGQQDAAGLADFVRVGGYVMPPNSDIVSGADNIQALWQGVFDLGLKELVLETIDLDDHGGTAIETGRYTFKADGGAVADVGKFIVVWKNDGGTWKVHRDIFNTNQPAA